MTDTMFTTTTGEKLGERLFRHYLATSVRCSDGYRVVVTARAFAAKDEAAAIWADAIDAGADAVMEMLAAYTRLVTGQRAIDGRAGIRYLDCAPDCGQCGGQGCAY